MKTKITNLVAVSVLLLTSSVSLAETAVEQQLKACSTIVDNLYRLNCYDKLARSIPVEKPTATTTEPAAPVAPAQTVTAQPTVPKQQAKTAKAVTEQQINREFGFENKAITKVEQIDKLIVNVKKIKTSPYGKLVIYLDNGQVWKQTDSASFNYKKSNGAAYIIRGALGSFMFSQEGTKRSIRIKRSK